jgi:hypothetical protein
MKTSSLEQKMIAGNVSEVGDQAKNPLFDFMDALNRGVSMILANVPRSK